MDDVLLRFCRLNIASITNDIYKLENPVPLSVLKAIFDNGKNAFMFYKRLQFNHLLQRICFVFSPYRLAAIWRDRDNNERKLFGNVITDIMEDKMEGRSI